MTRSIFLFEFVVAREGIKREVNTVDEDDDDNNNHRNDKATYESIQRENTKPKIISSSSFFFPLPLPNFLLFGYRERETRRTIATLGARHFYLFRIFHRRSKFISSSHKLQSLGSRLTVVFQPVSSAKMPRA